MLFDFILFYILVGIYVLAIGISISPITRDYITVNTIGQIVGSCLLIIIGWPNILWHELRD